MRGFDSINSRAPTLTEPFSPFEMTAQTNAFTSNGVTHSPSSKANPLNLDTGRTKTEYDPAEYNFGVTALLKPISALTFVGKSCWNICVSVTIVAFLFFVGTYRVLFLLWVNAVAFVKTFITIPFSRSSRSNGTTYLNGSYSSSEDSNSDYRQKVD